MNPIASEQYREKGIDYEIMKDPSAQGTAKIKILENDIVFSISKFRFVDDDDNESEAPINAQIDYTIIENPKEIGIDEKIIQNIGDIAISLLMDYVDYNEGLHAEQHDNRKDNSQESDRE